MPEISVSLNETVITAAVTNPAATSASIASEPITASLEDGIDINASISSTPVTATLVNGGAVAITVTDTPVTVSLVAGFGDVVGPASAVDSNFVAFNTTTGKLIKDSGYSPSSFELADATIIKSGNASWVDLTDGGETSLHTHAASGGDISGTGVVGQVAEFVTDTKTLQAAKLIAPSTHILTLTNAAAATLALNITSGKTLTLTAADDYTLTIPATGTAALLGAANVFTTVNRFGFTPSTPSTTTGNIVLRLNNVSPTAIMYWNGTTWTDQTSKYDGSSGEFTILNAAGDECYIGFTSKFTALDWLKGVSTTAANFVSKLWDGAAWTFVGMDDSYTITPATTSGFHKIRKTITPYTTWTAKVITEHASPPNGSSLYWLQLLPNNSPYVFKVTNLTISSDDAALVVFPGYNTTTPTLAIKQNGGVAIVSSAEIELGGTYSSVPTAKILPTRDGTSRDDANIFGWGFSRQYPNNIDIGYFGGSYGLVLGTGVFPSNTDILGVGASELGLFSFYSTAAKFKKPVTITNDTAATNTVVNVLTVEQTSTGTAANGLGAGLLFSIETATASTMQTGGVISASWVDATNATRKAKLSLSAYDTAARLGLEIEASGTEPMIGFYGVTPIARAVLATGAGASVDDVITALQNLGLVKQS